MRIFLGRYWLRTAAFSWIIIWARYSFPARRARSPLQRSSSPEDGEIDPGFLEHARQGLGDLLAPVVERAGAAHIEENRRFRPVAQARDIQAPGPVGARVAAEAPGIGLVFEVGEGVLHFGREARLHQDLMLAGLQQKVQVLDVHRADVLARPAGGAGP